MWDFVRKPLHSEINARGERGNERKDPQVAVQQRKKGVFMRQEESAKMVPRLQMVLRFLPCNRHWPLNIFSLGRDEGL